MLEPPILYHADMFDILPALAPGSIDMVCADLPYGITRNRWDSPVPFDRFWQAVKRVAKPTAVFALTATQPFAAVLISSNIGAFREDIIWVKNVATGFLNAKRRLLRAHEHVLIFGDKNVTYNPQFTVGPSKSYRRSNKTSSNYGTQSVPPYESAGRRYPTSVQQFSSTERYAGLQRSRHPTQKPTTLMSWLIQTYTNKGDIVLDPCMGSGTTGVACADTKRRFVGIEKSLAYFQPAKVRVISAYQQLGGVQV